MNPDDGPVETAGRESLPPRPPLQIVTGYPDDERQQLPSHHRLYGLAYFAWRHQDALAPAPWRDLWKGLVPHWPRARGGQKRPPSMDRYVAKLLMAGHGKG